MLTTFPGYSCSYGPGPESRGSISGQPPALVKGVLTWHSHGESDRKISEHKRHLLDPGRDMNSLDMTGQEPKSGEGGIFKVGWPLSEGMVPTGTSQSNGRTRSESVTHKKREMAEDDAGLW